jgi:hypothetical protein
MNNDPNDPEMWGKVKAWSEGTYDGKQDDELVAWLLTHYPHCFDIAINDPKMYEEIKRLEAEGVEITPDMFPGIKLIRRVTLEGDGWRIESGDPKLN